MKINFYNVPAKPGLSQVGCVANYHTHTPPNDISYVLTLDNLIDHIENSLKYIDF